MFVSNGAVFALKWLFETNSSRSRTVRSLWMSVKASRKSDFDGYHGDGRDHRKGDGRDDAMLSFYEQPLQPSSSGVVLAAT